MLAYILVSLFVLAACGLIAATLITIGVVIQDSWERGRIARRRAIIRLLQPIAFWYMRLAEAETKETGQILYFGRWVEKEGR